MLVHVCLIASKQIGIRIEDRRRIVYRAARSKIRNLCVSDEKISSHLLHLLKDRFDVVPIVHFVVLRNSALG